MTDKLQQITKEEIQKLPSINQMAINSIDWPTIVEGIGGKYVLSESAINDLLVQTLLVLIGLTSLDNYKVNVENEVGMGGEEADRLATEVTEKIFIPIANIGIEGIKNDIKVKNPGWEKSVDFVLSGGDYSVFMDENKKLEADDTDPVVIPVFPYDNK